MTGGVILFRGTQTVMGDFQLSDFRGLVLGAWGRIMVRVIIRLGLWLGLGRVRSGLLLGLSLPKTSTLTLT